MEQKGPLLRKSQESRESGLSVRAAAAQPQAATLEKEVLRMSKAILQLLGPLLNTLQKPTQINMDAANKKLDILDLIEQMRQIKSYCITNLIIGNNEASINDKQRLCASFEHICRTSATIALIDPEPTFADFIDCDDPAGYQAVVEQSYFLRAQIVVSADSSNRQCIPVAELFKPHTDLWWISQGATPFLTQAVQQAAIGNDNNSVNIPENIIDTLLTKLCASHPDLSYFQYNSDPLKVKYQFKDVLAHTAKKFLDHASITNYHSMLKPSETKYIFQDPEAYALKILQELKPYLKEVQIEIVRLVKKLCDLIETLCGFVIPQLRDTPEDNVDIDIEEIKALVRGIKSWWSTSAYFNIYDKEFDAKANFDPSLVMKAYQEENVMTMINRLFPLLTLYDLQLPLLQTMRPAAMHGKKAPIAVLLNDALCVHEDLHSQLRATKEIIADSVSPLKIVEKNGFASACEKLILLYEQQKKATVPKDLPMAPIPLQAPSLFLSAAKRKSNKSPGLFSPRNSPDIIEALGQRPEMSPSPDSSSASKSIGSASPTPSPSASSSTSE
jgi:hypothetical protein